MPTPRRLLATVLSVLACTVASAAGPAVATSSASSTPRANIARKRGGRSRGARASCARAARRARAASRGCSAKTRVRGASKPRRTHSRRNSEPAAPAEPTPARRNSRARPERSPPTIAAVLATTCQNTELTPEPQNIALVRAAVLCLINRKRAENGEQPLDVSPALQAGRRRPLRRTDRRRLLRARLPQRRDAR